jgi:hypothetical protein
MADVATFGGVELTNIGGIVSVNVANIASIGDVLFNISPVDLSTGLIGYYALEETGNASLAYTSRGTINGSTNFSTITPVGVWNAPVRNKTGMKNKCYQFSNNPSTGIKFGLSDYNFASGSFAVSMWINASTGIGGYMFSKYAAGGNRGYGMYMIGSASVGDVAFQVWANDTYQVTIRTSGATGAVVANTWTHLVFNKDASVMTIYVNDVSKATTSIAPGVNQSITANAFLGALGKSNLQPDFPYKGLMDEIAIWDHGLTEEQIADLYNGGTGKFFTAAGGFA